MKRQDSMSSQQFNNNQLVLPKSQLMRNSDNNDHFNIQKENSNYFQMEVDLWLNDLNQVNLCDDLKLIEQPYMIKNYNQNKGNNPILKEQSQEIFPSLHNNQQNHCFEQEKSNQKLYDEQLKSFQKSTDIKHKRIQKKKEKFLAMKEKLQSLPKRILRSQKQQNTPLDIQISSQIEEEHGNKSQDVFKNEDNQVNIIFDTCQNDVINNNTIFLNNQTNMNEEKRDYQQSYQQQICNLQLQNNGEQINILSFNPKDNNQDIHSELLLNQQYIQCDLPQQNFYNPNQQQEFEMGEEDQEERLLISNMENYQSENIKENHNSLNNQSNLNIIDQSQSYNKFSNLMQRDYVPINYQSDFSKEEISMTTYHLCDDQFQSCIFNNNSNNNNNTNNNKNQEKKYEGNIQPDSQLNLEEIIQDVSRIHKKNIVKNIMTSFKRFVYNLFEKEVSSSSNKKQYLFQKTNINIFFDNNDQQNSISLADIRQTILDLFNKQQSNDSFVNDQEFLKKYKRYIENKPFNHYTICLLLKHQQYSLIFKYFLENFVEHWLINSKISDPNSHHQMIEFLISSYAQPQIINRLQSHQLRKKEIL